MWPEGEPPFLKFASLPIMVESVCFTANNCSCGSKDNDGEAEFDPVKAFAPLEVFGFLFIGSVRRGGVFSGPGEGHIGEGHGAEPPDREVEGESNERRLGIFEYKN